MVKRHNKTGRRQILQLEDKKPPPPIVSSSSKAHVPKSLIHYSDSDGEADASVSSASRTAVGPIDTQVADFLKEIDALTVAEPSGVSACDEPGSGVPIKPDPENITQGEAEVVASAAAGNGESAANQDSGEVYCTWQQCHDESSGYSYYWNVVTNEVTWECPPEFVAYQKYDQSQTDASIDEPSQPSTSKKLQSNAKKASKRDEAILKEGAIIPISYFGGSSSSGSSDEEPESSTPTVPSKTTSQTTQHSSKVKATQKSKTTKKGSAEAMGPQLPPDFQFPQDVPSQPIPLDNQKELPSSFVIGPQLPVNYAFEDVASSETNVKCYNGEKPKEETESNCEVSQLPSTSAQSCETTAVSSVPQSEDEILVINVSPSATSDVPDSTTKKELVPPPATSSNTIGVKTLLGYRSVVEYDSFTDTDEETDNVCSSSTKSPTVPLNSSPIIVESSEHCRDSKIDDLLVDGMEYECSPSNCIAVKDNNESSAVNPLNAADFEEPVSESRTNKIQTFTSVCSDSYNGNCSDSPEASSPKRSYNDIVNNMFSIAKETGGKFGFGFDKNRQLDNHSFHVENEAYGRKSRTGYPIISFVKSSHILNLNTLNEAQSSLPKELPDEKECLEVKESEVGPAQPSCEIVEKYDSNDVPKAEGPSTSQDKGPVEPEKCDSKVIQDIVPPEVEKSVSLHKKEDHRKKGKVKKKSTSITKTEMEGTPVNATHQDSNEKRSSFEEEDIDQLLGNILKEMVESGESRSVDAAAQSKPMPEKKKKRSTVVPSTAPSKKKRRKEEPKEPEKKDDAVTSILDLAAVLIDKISFLVSNHSTMVSLSCMIVQIQTRLMDWQAGALDPKYFMDRLQEVEQYLQHYEMGAMTGDWTCQWDRENKRYFYVNERTQQSQWTFPTDTSQSPMQSKSMWVDPTSEMAMSPRPAYLGTGTQFPLVSSSIPEEQMHNSGAGPSSCFTMHKESGELEMCESGPPASLHWLHQLVSEPSPPPPPPGVDSPPPPPPMTPPPESLPPPPPDSTEQEVSVIPDVDMDLEDSNSSESVLFAGNEVIKEDTPEPEQPVKHFFAECSSTRSPEPTLAAFSLGVVSSTSVNHSETAIITKPPQPITLTTNNGSSTSTTAASAVIQPTWVMSSALPSCGSPQASCIQGSGEIAAPPISGPSTSRLDEVGKASSATDCSSSSFSISSPNKVVASNSNPQVVNKKEKKKTKLHAGLSFKKKNIPSLVQKWQKIKEEQEKEDNDSDEPKISTSMK